MSPEVDLLLAIAGEMFEEGYTHSEAYPPARWKKNGWPDVVDQSGFRLMDAHIKVLREAREYERWTKK